MTQQARRNISSLLLHYNADQSVSARLAPGQERPEVAERRRLGRQGAHGPEQQGGGGNGRGPGLHDEHGLVILGPRLRLDVTGNHARAPSCSRYGWPADEPAGSDAAGIRWLTLVRYANQSRYWTGSVTAPRNAARRRWVTHPAE